MSGQEAAERENMREILRATFDVEAGPHSAQIAAEVGLSLADSLAAENAALQARVTELERALDGLLRDVPYIRNVGDPNRCLSVRTARAALAAADAANGQDAWEPPACGAPDADRPCDSETPGKPCWCRRGAANGQDAG